MSENTGNPRSVDALAADVREALAYDFHATQWIAGLTHDGHELRAIHADDVAALCEQFPKARAALSELVALVETLQQKSERQATNIGALYRQRRAAESALADMRRALQDVARISDEALQDGHPGIPEMARVHRRAVSALDDALAAENNCPECGSGMLNGNHIAAYNCSRRAGQK